MCGGRRPPRIRRAGRGIFRQSTPFLLSLTKGDVSLVDDLAQETFIKAYLSVRSLEGITRFHTWLFRIAYNEFVSHTRRVRNLESVNALNPLDEPADETDQWL